MHSRSVLIAYRAYEVSHQFWWKVVTTLPWGKNDIHPKKKKKSHLRQAVFAHGRSDLNVAQPVVALQTLLLVY